jgi:hypothetical protein
VAALAVALLLGACGSPNTTSTVPSAVASAAAKASIAVPSGTVPPTGSADIVAPARAGQTLTVLNGYDNPMPGGTCTKGYGHDHCGNQEFGLDLVLSNPSDLLVLSPVTGTIAWPPSGVDAVGCVGIVPTAFPQLNLTVCHLSQLRATDKAVTAGEVLGWRNPADGWIHMSLDTRIDGNGKAIPLDQVTGVPFSGAFTIAGHDFPPAATRTFNLHACKSLASQTAATGDTAEPSPLPAITTASLTACGTAVATPTPKPTPAPMPKPTPKPAPPPAPTNMGGSEKQNADGSWTNTVTWQEADGVALSGFRVYVAEWVVGECLVAPCPPTPKCPSISPLPTRTSPGGLGPWVFVGRVGANVRKVSYSVPYGPAIYCGTWVVAYNAAGSSPPLHH